ncbi:unnamed protein product [Mytilus edulis]|uniref:Zinc finger PHD-type domain-containing protein n=1 Tax=Mytilus edulis TaxID=6550 RepID=A0A8S3REH0_MYTED|nr:unnamed protein product [Mytilus edulis]
MSIQTRTSARTKSKPQPYTPAKYENFSINKTRALDKKLEACNRAMDIKIEQKHQNYILELSAAAYEVLKGEIDIYFEQHSTYKLLPKHQHDNQGLCIRTSHSVRNRSNNRQLYRINLFHTTSKVEVNGQGMELFLTHIEDIKERMKSRGNYKIYNKQIEEQINIIKRNEADIEIRGKQNESLTTNNQPKTNHINRILVFKGAECIQNTDKELLSNWNRAIEWSEDEPTPSQDTSAVNMSTIHNYCAICNQTAQPETSIDCIACSQLFHYTCENIDPVRISQTEEEQYSYTEETIPKVLLEEQGSTEDYSEIGHIVKNMPDNTSKDSPTRTQITKEETGNSNTEVLDMLEMNKTASYKQHNQMVQNSRNEQIENVDEPKNIKAKPKRQYKCKNINETTQQLEDQLAQCRARLVIMEDTNRDYRNTINLLRMQSEESTIDKSNLKTYQPNCGCSNNLQEQTINKVDMMLNNFRLEMENRDLRIKHQMEMNELRNKLQIMELQKEVRMWQRPGSHEYYPYNQNIDNTRNSNQHQMSDQHTGVQLINQQSRIPNQANPLFMTPMAPPHYSQIPTEQSRINPGHIQAPMYHNSRIQAIPVNSQSSHHYPGYRSIHVPTGSINTNMIQNAHLYRQQYRMTPQPIPQNIDQHQGYSQQQTNRKEQSQRNINKRVYDQRTSMPVIAKQSHAEEIERQKQLQQLTNQADNIIQIDKEPTEEARMTINLTNSAAAKNDEVKAHTEVSHQVDVTPRTVLKTTASSGDAPLEADCHQKFPSQRGANVGGPKHLKGLVQADNLEAKEDGNRKKPNHFLGSGRSNKIKGRISL